MAQAFRIDQLRPVCQRAYSPAANLREHLCGLLAALMCLALLPHSAAAESPAVKAMQEYMEFAPYEAGIIVPQQLTRDVFESVVFIDTRDTEQFGKSTIPGARHIEWREVITRMSEVPKDKKVVLFCNVRRQVFRDS